MRIIPLTLTVTLGGCQDYRFGLSDDIEQPRPSIRVEPSRVAFPLTAWDGQAARTATIKNEGNATLSIAWMDVEGSGAFSFLSLESNVILPGESVDVILLYDPLNPTDEGRLVVESSDSSSPRTEVALSGEGAFPQLSIDPPVYDFGPLESMCGASNTFTLENVGLASLSINNLAHVGEGFVLTGHDPLPIALAPGEQTELVIAFAAADVGTYSGTLHVDTNEPSGLQTASQTAEVLPPRIHEDLFRQNGAWEGVDVLFWVDGSGSMYDDQENLASNISQFTTSLEGLTSDFRIMIAGDTGCATGPYVTPDTADKESTFLLAMEGAHGWEAGLAIAKLAFEKTDSGECNEGFLRYDAKTVVVLVSDEPEQSGVDWTTLVSAVLDRAPSTTISAIAGDIPAGCASAAAGTGYYEAVQATGGLFLSICDPDWGSKLQAIASTASEGAPLDRFELEAFPEPSTIAVDVDGIPTMQWTYDSGTNEIMFPPSAIPAAGADIHVTYQGVVDCEE